MGRGELHRSAARRATVMVVLTVVGSAAGDARAAESNRLAGCPATPNCVSSRSSTDGHHIRPFTFEGSPGVAWERLKRAVQSEPRLAVVEDDPQAGYLRIEATSRLLGFVDDVEFRLVPDAGIIDVRSASRVGYWDLGVNRRRVERLREQFVALSDRP